MPISLHTAVVGTFLQILPSLEGMLDKAEADCADRGIPPSDLAAARLADDMWPFAKQVFECGHHSARAIAGVRAGSFAPEPDDVPADFSALRTEIADAIVFLRAVPPDELDSIADRDMCFVSDAGRLEFTVADFLLTFTLPNFYFHATIAYAILRSRGVGLGKADFEGRLRIRA